ncbi:MAG: hypothetical protein F6J97_04725 [Leptolyngbya sp. SIO4C1]|nr:hypothetical protein [Leptolyngbya sp. SIO4C1]
MKIAAFSKERLSLRVPPFAISLTAIFLALGLIGILHHEMWRDELQAWMLARDSASVLDLFHNMRYEGHPALWHLSLYGLARITPNPIAMQLFHLAIAAGSVFLVAQFSPFTRLQKGLLAFGYFNFYEYAIISRSYGLGVFLTLLFCSLYGQQSWLAPRPWRTRFLPACLALALLANTSVYGLLLSLPLGLGLGLTLAQRRWSVARGVRAGIGLSGLMTGWLLCYWQIGRLNLADANFQTAQSSAASLAKSWFEPIQKLSETGIKIWYSYVPIPAFWRDRFWNSNVLSALDHLPVIGHRTLDDKVAILLALLLVGLVVRALWHQPKWLLVYGAGTATQLAFIYYFHIGSLRHHGHLFILLVACLWLAAADRDRRAQAESYRRNYEAQGRAELASYRLQKQLLSGLLVLHVIAGLLAYSADLRLTFSASRATAHFLRSHSLDQQVLFGYRDFNVSTVSGYLNQPIYYPNLERFGSFWTLHKSMEPEAVNQQVEAFVQQQQRPVVLLLTAPIERPLAGVTLDLLGYFQSQILKRESFYVYLAQPAAHTGNASPQPAPDEEERARS